MPSPVWLGTYTIWFDLLRGLWHIRWTSVPLHALWYYGGWHMAHCMCLQGTLHALTTFTHHTLTLCYIKAYYSFSPWSPPHSLDNRIIIEALLEFEKSQPKERGRTTKVIVGNPPKLQKTTPWWLGLYTLWVVYFVATSRNDVVSLIYVFRYRWSLVEFFLNFY